MWKKFFLGLLGIVVLTVASVTVLVKFFGLRVEAYGQGYKPHFFFFKPEEHMAALEKSREERKKAAPASDPVSVAGSPTATPASSSAAVPAAAKTSTLPLYWTNFRGPHRDGKYEQTKITVPWPADGLKPLWKQPSGGGYSSFVVAKGKAYTIEQRREKEVAVAYDMKSGREVWTTAWPALFSEALGGDGPRATPAYDEGRLYVLGASGEFHCLDAESGKDIWHKNILTEAGAANLTWGVAGSPLIVDGMVVAFPGGPGGKSVFVYDKLTGKTLWSALDDAASYTSPAVATLAGKRQLVIVTKTRVVGLEVADGKLLWQYPWYTSPEVNSAEPVFLDDHRFFLSAGYGHGSVVLDIVRDGDGFAAKTVWQNNKMKNRFNTSVYSSGYLYGLDEGILACVDANTGELKWKGGRYGYGQVLLSEGHLIVLTEFGELALVKATPEKWDELSKFEAIEGKTWNYPAIDGGVLLVRNAMEMAAFKLL